MKRTIYSHGLSPTKYQVYTVERYYEGSGYAANAKVVVAVNGVSAGFVEIPAEQGEKVLGLQFKAIGGDTYSWEIEPVDVIQNLVSGGKGMVGQVFNGVVVQTRTVAAGEGVNTGVQVSSVIFVNDGPFVASSEEQARGVILANAVAKVKDLNITDAVAPVEVRLVKY